MRCLPAMNSAWLSRGTSARAAFPRAIRCSLVGGVAAAACLAATQPPPLPLVEIRAERNAPVACSEVPTEDMFVMLDRSDSFLYVYNKKEGLLSLPDAEAETVRFRECQEYLDRD